MEIRTGTCSISKFVTKKVELGKIQNFGNERIETHVEKTETELEWVVDLNGDCNHLKNGEQDHWGFDKLKR